MNANKETERVVPGRVEEVSSLRQALACMLGAAETDCLDDKSNVWRSAMIQARNALKEPV